MPETIQYGIEFSGKGQPVKMRLGSKQFGVTSRDPKSGKQTWWARDAAEWERIRRPYFEAVTVGMLNFPVPVIRVVEEVKESPPVVTETVSTGEPAITVTVEASEPEQAEPEPTPEPATDTPEPYPYAEKIREKLALKNYRVPELAVVLEVEADALQAFIDSPDSGFYLNAQRWIKEGSPE